MDPQLLTEAFTADPWVFDVDATLVDGMSATSMRPGAHDLLTTLRSWGRRIVVWSAGGKEYAERRLTHVGLIDFVDSVHDKGDRGTDRCYDPDIVVDPSATSGAIFVDDQPGDLSKRLRVLAVRPYLAANAHDRELHRILEALHLSAEQTISTPTNATGSP